jgi:hypothetical protein
MKLIVALIRIIGFSVGFAQGFFAGLFGRRARVTHTFAAVVPRTKLLSYEGRRS